MWVRRIVKNIVCKGDTLPVNHLMCKHSKQPATRDGYTIIAACLKPCNPRFVVGVAKLFVKQEAPQVCKAIREASLSIGARRWGYEC